jgi:antitoxin component of MazEF toxin-antitoxin module
VPKTKLQKQLSRKVGNKEYAKWVLVIPPSVIYKLDWNEGDGIKHAIRGQNLVLFKERKSESGK